MNKIIVSGVISAVLFTAGIASAQVYNPYVYGTYSSGLSGQGACVNLASDLSYGSRGSDVSSLQSFLVAQNFPGGGSWMVTGYFGSATLQAVRNFQERQGIPMTGVADASTRNAIARVGCLPGQGGSSYYQNYSSTYPYLSYPYNYNFQSYTGTYPYNYNYNYNTYPYGSVALTSMSHNTGAPGTAVTLYGTGFDLSGNTVYFGNQALPGIPSGNGTSLTFTVPTYHGYSSTVWNQNVDVYVTNSRGTSNKLAFNLMTTPYACGYLGYGGYGNCYQYQTPPQNQLVPTATYLDPSQGGVGTTVTVYGTGFSTFNTNTVHFGAGVIANLRSIDGTSVAFTVPSQLSGFGSQVLTLSTYPVSVTNGLGYTTNTLPFTVTSLTPAGLAPSISSVNGPTTLQAGVSGTWTLKVRNPGNAYLTTNVTWGDEGVYGLASAQPLVTYDSGETTLTFTHIYATSGTRTVTFTVSNASGQSNSTSASVTVTGTGSQTNLSLQSLAPTSGPVGVQVTLYGTGFTYANSVTFGSGVVTNVYSQNGTTMTFTVPAYVSPYCAPYTACAQYAQQVTPGQYNVSVQNQNGTSNSLLFQVI